MKVKELIEYLKKIDGSMRIGGFCFEREPDPEEFRRVFHEMGFDSIEKEDYIGDETVLHISFCLHDDYDDYYR